ncbi:hypothetical protein SAMN05660657_02248 [Geodermatophilus amargosae]|uniref:Uncharacterized protein n=1 Tax=Geodermatophilus amargosae TaxID=1296565 RepID=A0A1I6ZUW8_9ACTN|nr:hypothetical protein [Geodermatophilus amargosae]SFT66405.1 hypothetical protein SAMN05660657_02248 [Geodermatophilus amargosae]
MSRPVRPLTAAAAAARDALPAPDAAAFDRLASAVLAAPGAALGPVLRAQLPGVTGIRWLRTAGPAPTARAGALSAEQWSKDPSAPHRSHARGGPLQRGRKTGGRTSAHGHAPGALAAPRWH